MGFPESARSLLLSGRLAHLVTINPDGSPQVSIVWVGLDGDEIVLQWRRTNMQSLDGLTKVMRANLRACGYPIVLSRPFDKRTPSHQCGTVRMGNDPANAPLDIFCRSFDHQNLFVVDGGFLPTSAAVNPALSIAAQALRTGTTLVLVTTLLVARGLTNKEGRGSSRSPRGAPYGGWAPSREGTTMEA